MYNKSEIFKAAWKNVKELNVSFSAALKAAWKVAKANNNLSAHKLVSDLAARVNMIDRAISVKVDGNYITGTCRGKAANAYKYSFSEKIFIFCGSSRVEEAFQKALV